MDTPKVSFSQISETTSGLGHDASLDVYLDDVDVGSSLKKTEFGSLRVVETADPKFKQAFRVFTGKISCELSVTYRQP